MARTFDAAIAELAERQHSVFALRQVRELGGSKEHVRHRREIGRWLWLRPGVYALAGAALTWRSEAMSVALWAGEGAVLSHRSAAELHGIDAIAACSPIDVTVPRGRYPTQPGVVTHRSLLLGPADVTTVDGIPTTTPVRVLIDSGLVVPKLQLELGYEDCRRRGLVTDSWMLRHLERLGAPLRKGSKPLVDIFLAHNPWAAPLESALELDVWDLIRSSDLPLPVRQYVVVIDGKKYRLDFAYPDRLLALEASGFRWHSGRLQWGVDQSRAAAMASIGWRIIPITAGDLASDTVLILNLIRRALTMAA